MKNFIALICIFGGMALITTLVESKKRWVRFIGETVIGLIGAALSSIIAVCFIGLVVVAAFGVLMLFFPNVDLWEAASSVGGLFFWVLIFVAFVVIKAWWDKRKEKLNKSHSEASQKETKKI